MTSSPSWAGVSGVIADAEGTGAVLGVSVRSAAGERFMHNGDRRFVAASTVKIPIMIGLFRQVDAGRQSLGTRYTVRAADKTTGSGVVSNLHDGIELTLADLAYLMMSISDNSATNILIDLVGIGRVNETIRELGMGGSTLGRKMRGRAVEAAEDENWAVPNDYMRVVAALFDHRAASPASCAHMLTLLEQQQNDRRIARSLPVVNRPRWGSKTGSLPGVVNDVGFVMADRGPVILAVFCETPIDPHHGEKVIGDIARAVLDREAPDAA